jgi:hypothetical protein
VRADERDSGYLFDVEEETYSTYYQWMLAERTERNLELIQLLYTKQIERDRMSQEIKGIFKQIQYAPLPIGRDDDDDDDDDERADSID